MPALAGLITRVLLARSATAAREIAQVSVKNHAHGAKNPLAHFQQIVTQEEVMESRMVADPLRLLHCCPISDGAAALVLTAEPSAVRIAGIGQGTDTIAVRYRPDLTSFHATQAAAREAAMAGFVPSTWTAGSTTRSPRSRRSARGHRPAAPGVGPRDPRWRHRARRSPPDQSLLATEAGATAAAGLAQVVECIWQLTGRAQGRQLSVAHRALAHSIGGLATNNWVTLLEAV